MNTTVGQDTKAYKVALGKRLARFRTERGLDLRAVAKIFGVSPAAIHLWERGTIAVKRIPKLRALIGEPE